MKKTYVILAIIIFVLLPGIVFFLVSHHGTGKVYARDLGIHPEGKDLASAQSKMQVMKAGESKTVVLNSRELTAWLNSIKRADTPLKETQVKINLDNTIEISGLLVTDRVVPYAESHGISDQAAQQIVNQLEGTKDVPVYIRCTGNITDGQLSLRIEEVQIQDVSLPKFIIRDKQADIKHLLQSAADRSNIRTLRAENGKLSLQFR